MEYIMLILWLAVGVLNLINKDRPVSKIEYACCYITLIMQLIIRCWEKFM